MGFSRQEDWSGLPFPYSEDLPGPGIKPPSPMPSVLLVDSLPTELCNIVTGILTVILNFQRLYSIYSYQNISYMPFIVEYILVAYLFSTVICTS